MSTKAVTPTGKKIGGKRAATPKRKANKDAVQSTAEDEASRRNAARTTLCEEKPYLAGLSQTELDKILDFLREAPMSLQQDFCSVIAQYATIEERATFLTILEELEDVSTVLIKTARLPQSALPQVHRLFNELGRSRFIELYSQEGERTQDFMTMLSRIPADLRTLLLRECQPLQFRVVTQLMDDVLTAPVMEKCRLCAMKRAKKFHTDQAFDYKTKFRRGCRLTVQEIKTDIWADPPGDALLSFRPSSRETGDGDSSFDVYFDNQKVDVFKTCLTCLRQVQRFVSEQGNAFEVYHTEGADQKRLLTDNVQLAHEKARWWTQKGHKMLRVIGLIELFVRCRKLLKAIRQEEERLQRMEQREREAELKREEERAKHEALVQRANMLDAKWLAQDRRAVQHLFRSKRMYCMLQEEQELGRVKNASSVRENALSTKLRGFMEPEDIPVTAERASEVFGTRKPDIKDYRPELRAWKEMATDYEQESNAYRAFREEMLKASEQKDFALRLERWRSGMKTIEERNTSRIMWERQEVRKRELIRHEKREKARAAFAEMEEEAARREQLAKDAHEAARLTRERELDLEARERRCMLEEELIQTRCDRFWGLDARASEVARLKKMWAKQRHDELKAKRKLMVQLKLIKEL